jgi:hypothetical protein
MSRLFAAMLFASVVVTPIVGHAFGLGDVAGMGNKNDKGSSTDLSGSQDQMVKQYVAAGKSVLDGNAKMADAVGLATEAAKARAAGDSMTDGATKGTLSDSDKVNSDTNTAVAAQLKNTAAMDAPAKEKFASGILSLAQGLGKYIGMKGPTESFAKGLSSASPMMLPKLQSGSYIVSSLPSNMKNLTSALSNAISYAKSHDIAVPKDATDVMSKL